MKRERDIETHDEAGETKGRGVLWQFCSPEILAGMITEPTRVRGYKGFIFLSKFTREPTDITQVTD